MIRQATEADAPALGRFGALLVSLHHEFDPKRFIKATSESPVRYTQFLKRELEDPDAIVLVAERAGSILGYVYAAIEGPDYMSLRGPAGVIHDLFVQTEVRGEGIGGALFDAAITAIQERGSRQIVLSTAHHNRAAQRLFSSRGFRPTMLEMALDVNGARAAWKA